jgi:hypothetical protein
MGRVNPWMSNHPYGSQSPVEEYESVFARPVIVKNEAKA